MITTLFLKLIILIIKILTWSIPNWFIPEELQTMFTEWVANVMRLNELFPIGIIFLCISSILWFSIIVYTYKAIAGLISLIRGGGELKI